MEPVRIGRILRVLRHRLHGRQADIADRAGVSQTLVSRAERGDIERPEVRTLRRLAEALEAELVVSIRWRAGDLDRLLDEGHAALAGEVARMLAGAGWQVRPEVTFSVVAPRSA